MKKTIIALCAASLIFAGNAYALHFNGTNTPGTGVVGSKHDMTQYTDISDSEGRVCAFCHTPHHSITGDPNEYLPLWSHSLTTQTSFTPYKSATFDVTQAPGYTDGNILAGASLLCMSCHDGTIAVDQHYGSDANNAGTNKLSNDLFGGTQGVGGGGAVGLNGNFSNDHPIGFSYTDYQKTHSSDLNPPSTYYAGNHVKRIEDQLGPGGLFTCATCHDVHNKDNVANTYQGGTTRNYFLLGDNNQSAFCLTCHNK